MPLSENGPQASCLYNELDLYPAQWLRNLSDAGHIARGEVDARSIAEITPSDVVGVDQFHTFAGIGAWSYALRLAGVPDDARVWTGSCPCQPFSVAGRGRGELDERHLWPIWRELIAECRPPIVFGEQVASPAGRSWLATVRADLEALGYAVGSADLCAAGVGAPHVRQRLFFGAARLENTDSSGRRRSSLHLRERTQGSKVPDADRRGANGACGLGHADGERGWGFPRECAATQGKSPGSRRCDRGFRNGTESSSADGHWRNCDWLACADGVARPVEPGTFPLVDGAPQRVGRLRAYGNAIVPQVAAAFISAFLEACEALQ